MAAKPPVPGVLKLTTNWTQSGQNIAFLLHLLKPALTAWGLGDITTALTTLGSSLATHLLPLMSSDIDNASNMATDLTSAMGLQVTDTGVGSGTIAPGTSAPNPQQCTARVTFQQGLRYRGGRFGVNLPGTVQSQVAASQSRLWTTAATTSWLSAIEALQSDLQGASYTFAGCEPCVVSYESGHVDRVTPLVLPILGYEVQQRICTRRRRLGKGVAGG